MIQNIAVTEKKVSFKSGMLKLFNSVFCYRLLGNWYTGVPFLGDIKL